MGSEVPGTVNLEPERKEFIMPGAVNILNPFDKDHPCVHPGESAQRQWPWETVADLTVATTALAGGQRNSTYVTALGSTKMGVYSPKNGQVAFEVRARSDGSDGDANVVDMCAAAKDLVADLFFYRRLATITFTQGTGEYWPTSTDPAPATIFFADELAITNEPVWISDEADVGLDASNDCASYALNLHGYAKIVFILTTLDTNTTHVYIDVRRM